MIVGAKAAEENRVEEVPSSILQRQRRTRDRSTLEFYCLREDVSWLFFSLSKGRQWQQHHHENGSARRETRSGKWDGEHIQYWCNPPYYGLQFLSTGVVKSRCDVTNR